MKKVKKVLLIGAGIYAIFVIIGMSQEKNITPGPVAAEVEDSNATPTDMDLLGIAGDYLVNHVTRYDTINPVDWSGVKYYKNSGEYAIRYKWTCLTTYDERVFHNQVFIIKNSKVISVVDMPDTE